MDALVTLKKALTEKENFNSDLFISDLKELGLHVSLADFHLLQKLARYTNEQEFSTYMQSGDSDDLPALKLTSNEMELLKGGWTLLGLGRMMIGSAGQGFAFRLGRYDEVMA
jgi:hypothetical protein